MGVFDFLNKPRETTPAVVDPDVAFKKFEELVTALVNGSATSTRSYNYANSLIEGSNPNPFIQKTGSNFETIDNMLDDESIFAILELKKQFVLSTGYRFSGPEKQVKFLQDNLETKYGGLFQEDLYQVQSAYEYGFSISEKIFTIDNGKMYLKRIKTVPPHSVDYYTDENGVLVKILQRQPKNPSAELPLDKMLIFVNIPKFDNPYGTSDLQRCYRAWLGKQMTVKFWNIYLQRFASPFPVAKVDDTFGSNNVAKMIKLLDSIQQTVSLVIPKTSDMELFKVGNSSGEYDKAIERYNQMIARALLLPDLVGFGQTTQGGSYSLGEQQFDLFRKVCDFNRLRMTELLNEKVFKQLIIANFGEQKEYAKFEFKPYDNNQVLKAIESFYLAIDKGMPAVLEDWNHIRDKIKFPNITEQDMEEAVPPTPPIGSDSAGLNTKSIINDVPKASSPDKPTFASNDMTLCFSETPTKLQFSREMTVYEEKAQIMRTYNELEIKLNATVKRAAEKLKDCREALKDFISRRDIVGQSKFEDIEKLKLKYMGDLRIIFQRDFEDIYRFGRQTALGSASKFVSISDTMLDEDEAIELALALIAQRAFLAVGKLNDKLLNEVKNILLKGMQNGSSFNDIANEINILFNDVTEGSIVAGLAVTPTLLMTVVQTNYANFYNLGIKQTINEDPDIEYIQYSAILDDVTTEICRMLDKKVYRKDNPIFDFISPPNHYNCRSRLVAVSKEDAEGIVVSDPVSLSSLRMLPGAKDFIGGS